MAILTTDAVYLVEGDYAANNNAKLLDFVSRQKRPRAMSFPEARPDAINVASMALYRSPKNPDT